MNGARAAMRTLVDCGVDVCFANPGTSEMHFVAALDTTPEMRGVLALFEGVVTGAADGYGRMADRPSAALLHLGPGLGNGLANLHNARRAGTPLVAIVGEHATYHKQYDAQLNSDIETVARNVSGWIKTSGSAAEVGDDVADCVAHAMGPPGQVATLILPADVSWSEPAVPAAPRAHTHHRAVTGTAVDAVAQVLRTGESAALLLDGRTLRRDALRVAGQIASATGARLLAETFPARMERGAGIPSVERIAYLAEFAAAQLEGLRHLILVDSTAPVSFFAYPGKPSLLVPDGCEVHLLADAGEDAVGALRALADALGARDANSMDPAPRPDRPTGVLTADAIAAAIGATLPEGAIVSDEANTSGLMLSMLTAGAPPHDWLSLTGGAIGQGLPVATGAAIAAPGRPVIALEADGSALYTIQALWTMVREGLDVTTVIFNNRSYAILNMELSRVGAESPGPAALSMLDLARPDMDFVAIAHGFGMPATRPETAEEFVRDLDRALAEPGPHLIEAVIPSMF